jgi:hypothetical protein
MALLTELRFSLDAAPISISLRRSENTQDYCGFRFSSILPCSLIKLSRILTRFDPEPLVELNKSGQA